jgi:DNA-directed RNA polymerase subunit N (RpoN/RPB10)
MIEGGLRRAVRRIGEDWREIDVWKRVVRQQDEEARKWLDSLGQHMSQCRRPFIVELSVL